MVRPRNISIILILLGLIIFNPERVLACRCEGESTVKDAVKYSDIVFSGKVISKTVTSDLKSYGVKLTGDTTSFPYKWTKFPIAVFEIKVDKLYKGKSVSDTITILTPINGAGCGFSFQVGEKYIVYGTTNDEVLPGNSIKRFASNNKTYWTNLCTRTTQWFKQEEDQIQAAKS